MKGPPSIGLKCLSFVFLHGSQQCVERQVKNEKFLASVIITMTSSFFQRELEDLAAFEMLEEAACDSSFCSSSSQVKHLISSNGNQVHPTANNGSKTNGFSPSVMPSPICKPNAPSVTSTPIAPGRHDFECMMEDDDFLKRYVSFLSILCYRSNTSWKLFGRRRAQHWP